MIISQSDCEISSSSFFYIQACAFLLLTLLPLQSDCTPLWFYESYTIHGHYENNYIRSNNLKYLIGKGNYDSLNINKTLIVFPVRNNKHPLG